MSDHVGEVYGKLTITAFSHKTKSGTFWKYRCECGTEGTTFYGNLTSGKSKSCGCTNATQGGVRRGSNYIPKGAVMSWKGMMDRCYLPKQQNYHRYGGRGIKVCERWHYLPNFLADMGEPPDTHCSIDRINNDGDYTPENCRWATPKEQARNRRDNRMLTIAGRTQCAKDWMDELGIPHSTFYRWLKREELSKIAAHVKPRL